MKEIYFYQTRIQACLFEERQTFGFQWPKDIHLFSMSRGLHNKLVLLSNRSEGIPASKGSFTNSLAKLGGSSGLLPLLHGKLSDPSPQPLLPGLPYKYVRHLTTFFYQSVFHSIIQLCRPNTPHCTTVKAQGILYTLLLLCLQIILSKSFHR